MSMNSINTTVTAPFNVLKEDGFYFCMTVSSCVIFLYVNGVMLYTLRSKPVFRETPRYILLYNLIFGDTCQLIMSFITYILALTDQRMLRSVCAVINAFVIVTVDTSSLTLAVMSLERYVAVCFPLRAANFVTIRGTGVAIAVVWAICFANTLFRFIMLFLLDSTPMNQMLPDYCTKERVFPLKILAAYEEVYTCIVFVSVGSIIIFSYVGVMVAARSASSDKASTTKARKTVLLHLIQLCLSLSTVLMSPILVIAATAGANSETLSRLYNILFMILIILPRCLSPLIYGLRDKTIKPLILYHIGFHFKHCSKATLIPNTSK